MVYLLTVIFSMLALPAQAYVGPGLVVMGNLLGPLIIFIPFLLLLLFFLIRWWAQKIKRNMTEKNKNTENDENL